MGMQDRLKEILAEKFCEGLKDGPCAPICISNSYTLLHGCLYRERVWAEHITIAMESVKEATQEELIAEKE